GIFNAHRAFSAVSGPSATTPYGAYTPSATNLPSQAAINSVFGAYGVPAGTVPRGQNIGFNPHGTLFYIGNNYKGSTALDFSTIPTLGTYNTGALNFLTIPLTRYSGFGRTEYEVSSHVKAYAQLNYTTYESSTQLAPSPASSSPAGKPLASPP